MPTIKQVIDKLQLLAENLDKGLDTPVLITVNAFVQGGVQVHIIDLNLNDVNYESTLEQFRGTEQTSGIVIGFIPKIYEENKTT